MKKIIYLCAMMLLCTDIMAQIDVNDLNWRCVLNENFDEGSSYWQWNPQNFCNVGDYSWKAYIGSSIAPSGEHQVYQFSNCQINTADNTMSLVSEYDSNGNIPQNNYYLPHNMNGFPSSEGKYFFSGAIEYYKQRYVFNEEDRKFRYGYFEIKCKLPVHPGAFPAFWLHGASQEEEDKYYEEIDIFEYSWSLGDPNANWLHPVNPHPTCAGDRHIITCGIYHNLTGESPNEDHWDSYGRVYSGNKPDVGSDFHVYGCEWMPDHVYWFFDGQLVNSYTNPEHIPCHPLILKANYAIDSYAGHWNGGIWFPDWFDTDTMTINYINVYQLEWDCETEEIIACQSDLDNFDYAVKNSISITSTINEPVVSNTDKVTFRVANTFEITGPFEVQQGGEFAVIQQDCPNDNNE